MGGAGGDVQHVARPGFDGVIVEGVAYATGQDENGVAGLAPCGLGRTRRVRRTLLIAQSDAEAGNRLTHLQAIGDRPQRMHGGGKQVGAVGHRLTLRPVAPVVKPGRPCRFRSAVAPTTGTPTLAARSDARRRRECARRRQPPTDGARCRSPWLHRRRPPAWAAASPPARRPPSAPACAGWWRRTGPGPRGRRPAGRIPRAPDRAGSDRLQQQ